MKIYPYIVQYKTDGGASPFCSGCTQGKKQRLDLAPFDIPINRIVEDGFERVSILAVHWVYDSIICYRRRDGLLAFLGVLRLWLRRVQYKKVTE